MPARMLSIRWFLKFTGCEIDKTHPFANKELGVPKETKPIVSMEDTLDRLEIRVGRIIGVELESLAESEK